MLLIVEFSEEILMVLTLAILLLTILTILAFIWILLLLFVLVFVLDEVDEFDVGLFVFIIRWYSLLRRIKLESVVDFRSVLIKVIDAAAAHILLVGFKRLAILEMVFNLDGALTILTRFLVFYFNFLEILYSNFFMSFDRYYLVSWSYQTLWWLNAGGLCVLMVRLAQIWIIVNDRLFKIFIVAVNHILLIWHVASLYLGRWWSLVKIGISYVLISSE